MVGLIPLLAVEILDDDLLRDQKEFTERLYWFLTNRPELANLVSKWERREIIKNTCSHCCVVIA